MPVGVSGEDIGVVRFYCRPVVYKMEGKLSIYSAVAR